MQQSTNESVNSRGIVFMEMSHKVASSDSHKVAPIQNSKTETYDAENEKEKFIGSGLQGFIDFTTSHGITHIYKTHGLVKKIVWIILTLACTALLIYHLHTIVGTYMGYSTSTSVSIINTRVLNFPAVTVCNLNAIKTSALPKELWEIISNKRASVLSGSTTTASNTELINRLKEIISLMSDENKTAIGYPINEFILSCTFDGLNCDYPNDFWGYFDKDYGNCYTFNSGKLENTTIKNSTLAGPLYGLNLVINVGAYDYIPFLSEETGVRIVVHNQSDMPFPGEEGITCGVGQTSNVVLKQILITKLSGNYGSCTDTGDKADSDNMFADKYKTEYTELACLKTCYQKQVVNSCLCFDANYPYDRRTPAFSDLQAVDSPCMSLNITQAKCKARVLADMQNMACENCTSQCVERRYEASVSTATYPSDSYLDDLVNKMNASRPSFIKALQKAYNGSTLKEAIKWNVMKINIYYSNLEYTSYEDTESYSFFEFIADLGGVFGLWLGWSILTFFELFEFIIILIRYCIYRRGHQNKIK